MHKVCLPPQLRVTHGSYEFICYLNFLLNIKNLHRPLNLFLTKIRCF